MSPLHYDKNFFSDAYLAQQVTWEFGLFLLSLVVLMAGLVLIRRAFGEPRRSAAGTPPPPQAAAFERYEIGARLRLSPAGGRCGSNAATGSRWCKARGITSGCLTSGRSLVSTRSPASYFTLRWSCWRRS